MQPHLLYLTAILALGFAAQWIAWRFRLPAILLLLGFGFMAGQYENPEELIGRDLLFAAVSLSVAVVLFEGGLNLKFRELREAGRAVFRLVTVGILITWVLTGLAAWWLLDFPPLMAALLGAILVVSGPTVIMPMLGQIRPVRRVGSVIKWEGIVNDPIGAVAAVLVFETVRTHGIEQAATGAVAGLAATAVIGGLLGLASALLLVQWLKRYWIPDYLQNIAFLTVVVLAYTISNSLQPESGLVTVTVLGVVLANQKVAPIKHIIEFKENLRVVLISGLFIVLSSRLKVEDLTALGWGGLAFVAAGLLVIRPAAVFLSTIGTELDYRERLFLAWLHPRGIVAAAVSSVFALELLAEQQLSPAILASAEKLAPATFLVIVGTVSVYGLSATPLSRWLKIADPAPQGVLFAGGDPLPRAMAKMLQDEGYQVMLVDTNHRNMAAARMEGLTTCWASVLSEYAREEIDFGGIGRLLAMTSNDEVNSLAVQEYIEVFGRSEVYQIPPKKTESGRQEQVSPHRLGRLLFGADVNYAFLARCFEAGWTVKKTPLTPEFDYRAFRSYYRDAAVVLFVIDEARKLRISTANEPLRPGQGQTLISLVPPNQAKVEATVPETLSA